MSLFDGIGIFFEQCRMFSDDVKHGSEWELEGLNNDMQALYEKTTKEVEVIQREFQESVNLINQQREDISRTTLFDFAHIFSNIKNVDIDNIDISISSIQNMITEVKLHQVNHQEGIADALTRMHISNAGIWLAREYRLSDEISRAKRKLGDLEVQCAEARKKCAQMKSVIHFIETTIKSVDLLNEFAINFNIVLKDIIECKGNNYRDYDSETKNQIRVIYNLEMALNYFITESIFDSRGMLREEFYKYIQGIDISEERTIAFLKNKDFYLNSNISDKSIWGDLRTEIVNCNGKDVKVLFAKYDTEKIQISDASKGLSVCDFCESDKYIFYAVTDYIWGEEETAPSFRGWDMNPYENSIETHNGFRGLFFGSDIERYHINNTSLAHYNVVDIYRYDKKTKDTKRIIAGVHLDEDYQNGIKYCFDIREPYRYEKEAHICRDLFCDNEYLVINQDCCTIHVADLLGNYVATYNPEELSGKKTFGGGYLAGILNNYIFLINSETERINEHCIITCKSLYVYNLKTKKVIQIDSNISFLYFDCEKYFYFISYKRNTTNGTIYVMNLETMQKQAITSVSGDPFRDKDCGASIVSVVGNEMTYFDCGIIKNIAFQKGI